MEPAAQKTSKSKRKRTKPAVDESTLSPEEKQRRERQRHLRDLALNIRAQGQVYNPKRHKGKQLVSLPNGKSYLQAAYRPRKTKTLQLILIPIAWSSREKEAKEVMLMINHTLELLKSAGVKCDVDTTTKLTPGQKYRHWEEKGVMLRVEIGPHEAQKGSCIFAVAKTAGQVAAKREVAVGKQLVDAVCKELGIEPKTGVDYDKELPEIRGNPKKIQSGVVKSRTKITFDDDDVGDDKTTEKKADDPLQEGGKIKKAVKQSGDDLDGDFGELVKTIQEQQQHGGKGKKSKQQQVDEGDEDAGKETRLGDKIEDTKEDKKSSKKRKKSQVVTF